MSLVTFICRTVVCSSLIGCIFYYALFPWMKVVPLFINVYTCMVAINDIDIVFSFWLLRVTWSNLNMLLYYKRNTGLKCYYIQVKTNHTSCRNGENTSRILWWMVVKGRGLSGAHTREVNNVRLFYIVLAIKIMFTRKSNWHSHDYEGNVNENGVLVTLTCKGVCTHNSMQIKTKTNNLFFFIIIDLS